MPYAAKRSRGLATPSAALAATPPAPNKRAKKGSTPESVGWKCPICATVLNREKDSGRHLRTHDPDAEKYPCEMGCIDKWFTQEASRNVHYKSLAHNKSRPHGCKYCNKGFTTSRVLDRHVDEIHGPGRYRFYLCGCGARFKRIESWHKHRKTVHARETVVRPDPQYKRDVLTLARSPTDEGNNDRDDRPRGLAAEEQVDVHPYWMRTETMPSVDSPPVGFVTPVHIQQENINTRSTNFRDQSATDQTSRSVSPMAIDEKSIARFAPRKYPSHVRLAYVPVSTLQRSESPTPANDSWDARPVTRPPRTGALSEILN